MPMGDSFSALGRWLPVGHVKEQSGGNRAVGPDSLGFGNFKPRVKNLIMKKNKRGKPTRIYN